MTSQTLFKPEMERDVKIGKITKDQQTEQKVEILAALRNLGEQVRFAIYYSAA